MEPSYSVTVTNKSMKNGQLCLFQKMRDQDDRVFSLAWLTKPCNSESNVTFDWHIEYNLIWNETGILTPGTTYPTDNIQQGASDTAKSSASFNYTDFAFSSGEAALTAQALKNHSLLFRPYMGCHPTIENHSQGTFMDLSPP